MRSLINNYQPTNSGSACSMQTYHAAHRCILGGRVFGTILEQKCFFVTFLCRLLSVAERRRSYAQKEASSVFWAVHRLHKYLFGPKLTISTVHQTLQYLSEHDSCVCPDYCLLTLMVRAHVNVLVSSSGHSNHEYSLSELLSLGSIGLPIWWMYCFVHMLMCFRYAFS